jgi:hypothetical protein
MATRSRIPIDRTASGVVIYAKAPRKFERIVYRGPRMIVIVKQPPPIQRRRIVLRERDLE